MRATVPTPSPIRPKFGLPECTHSVPSSPNFALIVTYCRPCQAKTAAIPWYISNHFFQIEGAAVLTPLPIMIKFDVPEFTDSAAFPDKFSLIFIHCCRHARRKKFLLYSLEGSCHPYSDQGQNWQLKVDLSCTLPRQISPQSVYTIVYYCIQSYVTGLL